MNDENKWFAIMACVFFVCAFGGIFGTLAYRMHEDSQVKIACYDAAKTNPNIKCEKL